MPEPITLTLVPWGPGTEVGAYPKHSEQMLPEQPPTMIPPAETRAVADDASLTYDGLADGDYFACAPLGDVWQYVTFRVETPQEPIPGPPGPQGPAGPAGPAGSTPSIPIVTAIPASAADGDQVYLQTTAMANLGVRWHFVYRASGGTYKWEFAGGPPIWGFDSARNVSNNVGFVAINPVLTAPAVGDYEYTFTCDLDLPADNSSINARVGPMVASVDPAVTLRLERSGLEAPANGAVTRMLTVILTNVTLNATISLALASPAGATNAGIANKRALLRPIRVGP